MFRKAIGVEIKILLLDYYSVHIFIFKGISVSGISEKHQTFAKACQTSKMPFFNLAIHHNILLWISEFLVQYLSFLP